MKNIHKYALIVALLSGGLGARTAHADPTSPPPVCSMKGAACHDSGKDGVCVTAKCKEMTPEGDVNYDCLACDVSDGGAAGTGGAPGSAGATAAGGAPSGGTTASGGSPNGGATTSGGSPSAGATNASGAGGSPSAAGATNSAGNTGTAGATSAAGNAGSAGDTSGAAQDAGCSCSTRALGSTQNLAAFMLGIGALAFAISRRRQR